MPIAVRSAVLNDVPAILGLERQAPSAAHWSSEQYGQLLNRGVVLVAEEIGEHVAEPNRCGFVCAKPVAGEWEIENIVVGPGSLRRGVASGLLCELLQRAKNEAASAILLEVRESNQPARRLYEKHDFREVGRRRTYYANPAEDAILYTLRFDR